jgi:hypothetical protein
MSRADFLMLEAQARLLLFSPGPAAIVRGGHGVPVHGSRGTPV